MKLHLLKILFLSIAFTSCKKDKNDITPTTYEEIKWKHISARINELTETIIPISSANGLKLPPGSVVIFKTNQDRLGKLRINSINSAQNYLINISAVVYENGNSNGITNNGDNLISVQTNSLNIRGGWGCNLDSVLEVNPNSTHDFWTQIVNSNDTDFRPANGAKFAKYIF